MEKREKHKRGKGKIITASGAATILHMSPSTFIRKLENGEFPFPVSKIGRDYKFRREDIEKYFENSFKMIKNAIKSKEKKDE